MILEIIPFNNVEANQRTTNLNLGNQLVTVQINTLPKFDILTTAYIGEEMTCSIWLGDQLAVGGVNLMPQTNFNTLNTPAMQLEKLQGFFFIYSPYTTALPKYTDFDKGNIYKFFYSDYMDFTDQNFIKQLKANF